MKPEARRSPRDRAAKLGVAGFVAALHCLLFWRVVHRVQAPSTKGDGSSSVVAFQVALAPSTILEDPRSQGADEQSQTLVPQQSSAPADDSETQAAGAGTQPDILAGGSHSDDDHVKSAEVAHAGGGGGSADDPYARAALKPNLDTLAAFDLTARNDALFVSRVTPCLKVGAATLAGVQVAVSLGQGGVVTAAAPVRPGGAPGAPASVPTRQEAEAIAAVRACAPYHDIVLGSSPVLRMPKPAPQATPVAGSATTMAKASPHGVQG